jgi:hypothetical protein
VARVSELLHGVYRRLGLPVTIRTLRATPPQDTRIENSELGIRNSQFPIPNS